MTGICSSDPIIFSTAAVNSRLSYFMTKAIASPVAPHPKQWKNSFSSETVKLGDFSSWNGQHAVYSWPDFFRFGTYLDMTATIEARARCRSVSGIATGLSLKV